MLWPVCQPAGEITLPKSYPWKQVPVLVGLGTSYWVRSQPARRPLGLHLQGPASPRQKEIRIHGWSPTLGLPKLGHLSGKRFPPAVPAASLAAGLHAIYTSLHGHFMVQKGLVEKLRK